MNATEAHKLAMIRKEQIKLAKDNQTRLEDNQTRLKADQVNEIYDMCMKRIQETAKAGKFELNFYAGTVSFAVTQKVIEKLKADGFEILCYDITYDIAIIYHISW